MIKNKIGAPSITNEEFLKRIFKLNNNIEILEEYKGFHVPILFKNKYGICKVQAGNLLKGKLGSLQSAIDKTAYMIEQFKEKHNNKYTYPNFKYVGNRVKGKIECPIHGEFEQLTDVHLMGSGCRSCAFIKNDNYKGRGYSRSDYIKTANGRDGILYILKCFGNNEKFYKIGITIQNIKIRYNNKEKLPYKYEIIFQHTCDAGCVWDLEKLYLKKLKNYRYKPLINFKGYTECLDIQTPIEEIKNNLKIPS